MVTKQLVFRKDRISFSVAQYYWKILMKQKLKIAQQDCVYRSVYHIDYAKTTDNVIPLYLVIPKLYGSVEEQKGYK